MLPKAGANGRAGWRGNHGRTLLHAGAEGGNAQVVSALLRAGAGADKNTKSQITGRTPLHLAVVNGKEAAAKVLMLAGADVNVLDAQSDSPLHLAIAGGHVRLACDLLLSGADPDLIFQQSYPIHLATRLRQYEVVRDLTHKGADVNCLDSLGSSPLFLAVSAGHLSITRALLDGGADVRSPRPDSMTLLHVSAWWNNPGPVIRLLVQAGLAIEVRNSLGQTPLSVSAYVGACAAMLALLQLGADVNSRNNRGWTPLHGVSSQGFDGAADLLLKWGADETLKDNQGKTPGELVSSVVVDQVAEQVRPRLERVSRLLARARQDRAWRRRGWVVMCRARSDRLRRTVVVDGDEVDGQPREGPAQRARTEGVKMEVVVGGGRGRGAEGGAGSVSRAERGGESDGANGGGSDGVAAWLMGLKNEGLFRKIVGYL